MPCGLGAGGNFAEWPTRLPGDTGGVGVLDLDPPGADLHPHAIAVDLDFDQLTRRRPTLDGVCAYPEAARFGRQAVAEITDENRVAQDVQYVARPALFHQYRYDPSIERAIVEQRGDGVGEGLAGHVVEIHLELDELLTLAER
jgi:hypothetical protein